MIQYSIVKKNWGIGIYTCPENLDHLYFHISRKPRRVVFLHLSRNYGPNVFFVPGHLGVGQEI
jgi:hypothetical protein